MPSFGGGFAQGLRAGSDVVNNAVNVYQKTKLFGQAQDDREAKEQMIGSLFGDAKDEQWKNDLAQYDTEMANLGELDHAQQDSIAIGREELAKAKPSQLFLDKVVNMGSQERLGHMIELSQQNGIKISEASLSALNGVNKLFDTQRQNDDQHEQRLAQTSYYNQRADTPSTRHIPQTIQEFEYAKGNGFEGGYEEFLKGVKRNSTEMSPYQQAMADLRQEQQDIKKKESRSKAIKYLEEELPNWSRLKGQQKEQAVQKYLETGYLPTINKKDAKGIGFGASSYDYTLEDEDTAPEDKKSTPKKIKTVDDILNNL